MKFVSKQLLYILIFSLFNLSLTAQAGSLKIERFSMPIKVGNKISQPINLSLSAEGNWRLLVEILDSQIRNQDNPSFSIPVTRLELAQLGGTPISNFDVGKIIEIKSGDINGASNLNLALNLISFDSDRPGNYTADIKFTLVSQNNTLNEDVCSLRFMKDEIASIDFSNRVTNLAVDRDKTLEKASTQNLSIPLGLYISSNKNWKLYIRKLSGSKDTTISYFVKVLGGDQAVNYNMTNEFIPMKEAPILLASGKSTINDSMNCLDKKLVNIDYQIKGPEEEFIPAGTRSEEFEYRLETED